MPGPASDFATSLTRAIGRGPTGGDWYIGTVATVETDGTLTVTLASGSVRVPRQAGYALPAVGDRVIVHKAGGGTWIVSDRIATSPTDGGGQTVVMNWTALGSLGAYTAGCTPGTPAPRMRKLLVLGTPVWEFEGRIVVNSFPAATTLTVFMFSAAHRVSAERGFQVYASGSAYYGVRVGFTSAGNLTAGVPSAGGSSVASFVLDDVRITNP